MRRNWQWEKITTWERPFWALMSDIVNDGVVDLFRKSPPRCIAGDDLTWLDDMVREATGNFADTKTHLRTRIREKYGSLRAYHGTRTEDVQRFYAKGLIPLDTARFDERAKQIFLTPEFPELSPAHVEAAAKEVGIGLRHGFVYFAVNHKELIESCGHYMLYGSEYLVAIAAHIRGSRDYRKVLMRTGLPTIFVCNVPLSLISDPILDEFSGQALAIMFERVLNRKYRHPQSGEGGGFEIREQLPARCLVKHFHPDVLYDPLAF